MATEGHPYTKPNENYCRGGPPWPPDVDASEMAENVILRHSAFGPKLYSTLLTAVPVSIRISECSPEVLLIDLTVAES